ncbi:MAG: glycosyltransferase [Chloroflexi bacterium]|nr:glycosyltransferase [Chloroflexota bacterium]MCI0578609.1 glycosyltransferase [Chloroflexota bacterium]MCI0647368.1 glycosyltransferase [Chloroflexota bacterium]MCI0727828.1 glycosyltransferase [Chloroflexota bacterium]
MNSDTLPRRIAMISMHTCPLATLGGKKTGGMNVYVRDFSRELARHGIQVDVFTRSEDDCQPQVKHDLGYGARVIHIPAGPEKPIPLNQIARYTGDFINGVLAFAQAEQARYDLIHSHYWLSGLVAEGLRQAWGQADLPIVQMFHTLGHMKNRIAQSDAERAPQSRIDGEEHVMAVADRIIAATPAEQAQLNWLYGADSGKIVIIPPGVDLERFSPIPKAVARERAGVPPDYKSILFAGRIEPLKGIDTLLRAMALIQLRCPYTVENVCVHIIGGDPWAENPDDEMARLQEMRRELGVESLVTFLGAKDQDVLPNYYAAAKMVIMPSHYESFGMVALEAMAMGTPVIASEVGGLAFLVRDGENGFTVPSRDPEALAERIFNLLNDDDCRRQLGRQAQAHAQQYAWPKIVDRMLNVYRGVLTRA